MMKTFLIACLILLLAMGPATAMPARAQTVMCQSKSYLTRATSVTQATTCFTVAAVRTGLRLDLAVTNGAYDLYVKPGNGTSLTDADKANVGAASGGLSYILANPSASTYIVAVVRTSRSGTARLSPVTYKVTSRCSGATCTLSYSLASVPGPRFGDQVIFPLDIGKAGRVEARVTWKGTARLSAMLYGPSVSKTSLTQSSLARRDGASPLIVTYDVRSTNLIRGGRWSTGLSNAGKGGGTVASGELLITYPR